MLGGWYCRTLANEQAQQNETEPNVDVNDSSASESEQEQQEMVQGNNVDYRTQYRYLKRKLKYLIYENEFFQDALRSNQRRLLKVSRDRAFLLDRLLQYEKPENTSSESDGTESSEDEATKEAKKRKMEQNSSNTSATNGGGGGSTRGRKKKVPVTAIPPTEQNQTNEPVQSERPAQAQRFELRDEQQLGHMTAAEVERHLQSKQPVIDLLSERAPATVPTEMFSNEPSLDSESNDHFIGSSPTHVAAEECVPMEYSN